MSTTQNPEGTATPEGRHGNAPGSARWHWPSHLRLWLVAAVGLGSDLLSKRWAFTRIAPDEKLQIIPHVTSFERSLNTGALFGLGQGWTPLFVAASILALAFVLFLFVHSTRDRRSLHIALGLVLGGALGNLWDRVFVIADVVTVPGRYKDIAGTDIDEGPTVWTVYAYPEGEKGGHKEAQVETWRQPESHRQGVVRDFIKMEPHIRVPIPFTEGKKIDLHYPWVFNIADALLVVGVAILMLNFWWDRRAELAARAQQQSDAACTAKKAGGAR